MRKDVSPTSAKVMLAVGITALVTTVVLISVFLGYLYVRDGTGTGPAITASDPGTVTPASTPTPRPRSTFGPAASEITRIRFSESSMASNYANRPAAFFSNVNVQNFTSSSRTVTFSSDGTALREIITESTVNGVKNPSKIQKFTATIPHGEFAELAKVFADNDFVNEPDSKDITSLPIKKALTVTYSGGEKTINTGHMNRDTPETAAMLGAFKELEKQTNWKNVP